MYGPGNYDIDISLRRNFAVTERAHLTFEGNLYNLTNHIDFLLGGTAVGSASIGTVSGQANSSRDAQLSLRLEF